MTIHDHQGHVEPGGPAHSRTVTVGEATVEVRKFSVGPLDNNVYLLRDVDSGAALLVDAANEPERILSEIGDARLVAIVTTHGHQDHWEALGAVADTTGAPVWIHPDDAPMVPREPDEHASDGETVPFGGASVRLIHTPGHTPGSTCLLLGDTHLFSGDTLFPGGPGGTFGDSEAFATIMRSLRERLFVLGDDTRVYPGHGDDTTIGRERPSLDDWQERGW